MVVMIPCMAFAEDAVTTIAVTTAAPAEKSDDIVILATSDVHCGVDDSIGYAGLAQYKSDMEAAYKNVVLVDAGDAIQGGTMGTLSKGEYLVEIMNEVGYDILIPGNHEFDYGMDQFLNVIAKELDAEYVACNFVDKDGNPVFKPYVIKTLGEKKIAFLGISTPETFVKSTPTYFQDAEGNYIYGFCQQEEGKALYAQVQKTIDEIKAEGADVIVALAHLGNDAADTPVWKISDVLANTTGIDVAVDGHDHDVAATTMKDKAGKEIPVVKTGTKLANIGKVVLKADGTITVENVAEVEGKDAAVEKVVKDIQAKYEELVSKKVATSTVDLVMSVGDTRYVRSTETNLGDLVADAYRAVGGTDIAFANGGGIRANIAKGDITYNDMLSVQTFGNKICTCEATGQEILDALELGAKANTGVVGKGESGGFLQVSGLTYTINTTIPSSVVLNENSEFVKVDGAYRVSNVMVGGEPLDLEKTYTLACHDYKLKNGGDGFVMFKDNKFLLDEICVDNEAIVKFVTENLGGKVGSEYANPQGRITIISAEKAVADAERVALMDYAANLKVTAGKKYAKVTFDNANLAGVKYQIYRSTSKTTGFKKVISTSKCSYKNSKLTTGKTYYYKVRAYKKINGKTYYSDWSTVKSVKVK